MAFQLAPLILSATADSGLPVTLTVLSGPATLTGNSLKLNATGTITISATQAGNAGYLPAADVVLTFNVSKVDQTLDFAPLLDRLFTIDPIPLSAHASSNLPVTLTLVSGPATIQDTSLFLSATGAVTVRASQDGDEVYNAAPIVEWTMHVSKGPQVITFAPLGNKQYLDPPVDLSVSVNSDLPVSLQLLSGPGKLDGLTLTILGAGPIMLKAECPGDERFENAAPVTQAILVNKAHVPISWPKPADVPSGTVLGPAQLDATSTIP